MYRKRDLGTKCFFFANLIRVGYVFESRFSKGVIQPISMIFGVLNEERSNFKKMLYIFSLHK